MAVSQRSSILLPLRPGVLRSSTNSSQGYTSLGATTNTEKNIHLKDPSGSYRCGCSSIALLCHHHLFLLPLPSWCMERSQRFKHCSSQARARAHQWATGALRSTRIQARGGPCLSCLNKSHKFFPRFLCSGFLTLFDCAACCRHHSPQPRWLLAPVAGILPCRSAEAFCSGESALDLTLHFRSLITEADSRLLRLLLLLPATACCTTYFASWPVMAVSSFSRFAMALRSTLIFRMALIQQNWYAHFVQVVLFSFCLREFQI